jgi:hypothetical protein
MSPLTQALLLCGLAGMVLGVLLTLAGLHELSHRTWQTTWDPFEGDELPSDTSEPPSVRGRW